MTERAYSCGGDYHVLVKIDGVSEVSVVPNTGFHVKLSVGITDAQGHALYWVYVPSVMVGDTVTVPLRLTMA